MKKIVKKSFKILGIVLLVLLVVYISFIVSTHIRIMRGDLVKWDNKWFTKKELKEAYPPQEYNVEAKNTPEEVYEAFRWALLNGDIDGALELIIYKRKEIYRIALKDKEKLNKLIISLSENIELEESYGNFSYYNLNVGDGYKHTISFEKDQGGYWKIDSI